MEFIQISMCMNVRASVQTGVRYFVNYNSQTHKFPLLSSREMFVRMECIRTNDLGQ